MNVFVVGLEPIEQRYTAEWAEHLPTQIEAAMRDRDVAGTVRVIDGPAIGGTTTAGAFLDFAGTNVFKAAQTREIAELFQAGVVQAGDRFLFADAWHPGVIAVRYMRDLLDVPAKLVGLFHAGAYDPQDFIGRIDDRRWANDFERSLSYALDVCCFASNFHVDMFKANLGIADDGRILRCGWPMEYLSATLAPYRNRRKRNLVLFPHRLAPEKQIEIFRDLAGSFPACEFRVCQDSELSKAEYHALLAEARLVFSASRQETLGIGIYEGMLCGCRPFVPDRLSYREMYPSSYRYPSEWTENWTAYVAHKRTLVATLEMALLAATEPEHRERLDVQVKSIGAAYFDGAALYDAVIGT